VLALLPEEGSALAVVTNHQRGGEVGRAAAEAFGIGSDSRAAVDVDAGDYLGTYGSSLQDVELRHDDGQLLLAITPKGGFPKKDSPPMPAPPPFPVAFYERDRLFVSDGPAKGLEAEFLRGTDGEIAWFRVGGRVMQRIA
jgi:hypothetical protein